jgi:hypothetical protein
MSDGHDCHKLEPLGEFQDLQNAVPVFKDFTDPHSAQVEGMQRQEQVLQAGTNRLAIFRAVI